MSEVAAVRRAISRLFQFEDDAARREGLVALDSLRSLVVEADSAISHLHYRKSWPLDVYETDRLIARLREAVKE